jgi:hypothetical protein
MTKEDRIPKSERVFELCLSDFFRHSSFDIRHFFCFRLHRFSCNSIFEMPHRLPSIIVLVALAGCAVPWTPRLALPSRNVAARDQLTIHSDFPLPGNSDLLDDLVLLRSDINGQLGLPVSGEPIHVYLFDNEEHFRSFMRLHHPDFPSRRAFFLETKSRMEVYAQGGGRMAEDLRHEVTHGYLHSAAPNLPLWLDEGLAKYYEAPRGRRGLNRPLVEWFENRPPSKPWKMDLPRLEKIQPDEEMTLQDYAEAWAWVHFLLEDRPEYREILRRYLADLRRDGAAEPLASRLTAATAQPEKATIEHLRRILGEGREK